MATAYGIDPAHRYSSVARGFHAAIAVLVIGNLAGGLLHDFLPKDWNVIPLHKSMGLLILVLSIGRILWRFTWKTPAYRPALKPFDLMLAKTVHVAFYALILIMPLSGWIFSSASKYGAAFFGIPVTLPVAKGSPLAGLSHETHEILGYAMAALVVLHVGAALRHHLILKDGVLRRMW
ncbi:cytochrome b [Novosphingobium sp. Gsoil 351]|uniref:cytochrome b n=1 Tax=Novosphingobium sp. Gsoil 351 TaxID=2675225 RepID=UPI0012B483A1|nr:cytochrome b [Novosphingobium sp. Gsoil 351]QGN53946.1 cytochrome b [Novosphingobium sp. Gsoil 351]